MAAATLMNPSSAYHPHSTPFSSPHHHHPPPPPMPGMISTGESRRTPNEPEPAQRQSLPSLSEVFSAGKSTYSPTTPTTLPGPSSLPPPFSSAPPPRSEPGHDIRPTPPHEDGLFRYAPRADIAAPRPPTAAGHPFPEPRDLGKAPEPTHLNGSHPGPPPHIPYPPQAQLPPGQFPLSQTPISPRHLGPIPPYEQQRPPIHSDEEYGMHRNRYDPATVNRHFEAWGYQDCLQRVSLN